GLLRRVLPLDLVMEAPEPLGWRTAIQVLAPVLFFLSALSLWAEIAYTIPGGRGVGRVPGWLTAALGWVAPLRSFNGYGLFRVMTTERPELVGEGSRDGQHWQEYEFRYQPRPGARAPAFGEPHHPPLTQRMRFGGLD